jgi:2-(1,2-epoxy-1,2-dihydrophenyl)acetyl-CoA isomerase
MIAKSLLIISNVISCMQYIIFNTDHGVANITLNRPERLNAFNRTMALELQDCLDHCANDENIRAVILTGTGKGFCAGQDLAELLGPDAPTMAQILSEHYNPIVTRIRNLPKPVLAAVNGVAAGAGANIALCADIVVAAASASFIQAFSKIGLIPDSGGTFMLPRLIGFQKASALMMLGDKIPAQDAERLGMIYRIFPDESFHQEVNSLGHQLAAMPTKALAFTKHALNQSMTNNLAQQLTLEDRLQQDSASTEDYREGVDAFVNKRTPSFKGK